MSDKTPTGLGREPAPSSPDRIEAVARALYGSWSVDHQPVSQAMARDAARRDATTAVAALDAYDREHGRG